MKYFRKEIIIFISIFIISFFLVSDLFLNKSQPATFDGPTHLANIAMFYKSLKQGEFPVTWTDGFANYGMPLGLMAQQTTSYLGAFINFFTNNILLSYNLVFLIGAFFSSLFFYWFLRLYFSEKASFIGAFLFNFAPYRIINIYIRGALPEFFASVFLPLILIGIYLFLNKKDYWALIFISISSSLLVLTHPFTLIIYSFIYIPYIILNLIGKKKILKLTTLLLSSFVLGILLVGYYIIPLKFELKYFYYGLGKNHLKPNQFLSLINYIDPRWFYFFKNDIFTRGHFIKSGLLETIIVIFGLFLLIKKKFYKNIKKFDWLFFSVFCSFLVIFFTTSFTGFLYKNINILGEIQHPWRMMSSFIFLPPMILAYFSKSIKKNIYLYILIIIIAFYQTSSDIW